jgi:hypothetical protein
MMRSSCYSAFLLRGSQLSRANTLAYAELASIDLLPVSAIGAGWSRRQIWWKWPLAAAKAMLAA